MAKRVRVAPAGAGPATPDPFVLWVPPGYTFRELCADASSRWGTQSKMIAKDAAGTQWPDGARVLGALATAPGISSSCVYMHIGGPTQRREEAPPQPQPPQPSPTFPT